jgi:sugar phosphate isomerase/epimerase
MLDLGFVSAILSDLKFEEVISFAAKNGFRCVEIMCWPSDNSDTRRYAGVTHIDVANLDKSAILKIKKILSDNNIYISGLGYYPNPLDPDKEKAQFYQAHIKKVIKACALLDIPVMNTFIGRDPKKNLTENLEAYEKAWKPIVKVAEDNNVKIGIENCPMWFTGDEWPGGKNLATTPSVWDKMFDIIPSPALGLNYDPSHLVWQMMDEVQPIYQYAHKMHHIHLKDVKVYREKLNRVGIMANPLEYHSPKLPGLGDVNWRAFFAALTDIRYRGPVCIEVEDKGYENSLADRETAIRTSRNYLRQFLGD